MDSNIQQLRSDFDSNLNIGIQTSMFMLSLSLILWSGITFLLERWIDTFKKSINTPTYLLNVSVLDLYIGLMFLVVIIAKYCLTKTTRILGKDVESYIKDWFKSKSVCNKDKKVI